MLSSLPKLLGKSFIIGYLLPATLFYLLLGATLSAFAIDIPALLPADTTELAKVYKLLEASFAVILLAIILLAINEVVEATLQGHVFLNPLRPGTTCAKRRFREKIAPVLREMGRLDEAAQRGEAATPNIDDFSNKLYKAVLHFPDDEEWVVATRFGNVARAIEVYPRVVYGLDGVPAWPHLLMLVSKQSDDKLKDARAIVDFLMNIVVLSFILLILYGVLALPKHAFPKLWIAGLLFAALLSAWLLLPTAALQWGRTVKAIFDLHRRELATRLGFIMPATGADEFVFWQNVSKTMIYRSKRAYSNNDQWRAPPMPTQDTAAPETVDGLKGVSGQKSDEADKDDEEDDSGGSAGAV